MYKILFILSLGIAIGYGYGWRDAQVNEQHVGKRLVGRVVGDIRDKMSSDTGATPRAVMGK